MEKVEEKETGRILALISNPWYKTPAPWDKLEALRRSLERATKQFRKTWDYGPVQQAMWDHADIVRLIRPDLPVGSRDQFYWDFIQTKTEARRYADLIIAYRKAMKILNPCRGGPRRNSGIKPLSLSQNRKVGDAKRLLEQVARDLHKKSSNATEKELLSIFRKYRLARFGLEPEDLKLTRNEGSYHPPHIFASQRLGIVRHFLRNQ